MKIFPRIALTEVVADLVMDDFLGNSSIVILHCHSFAFNMILGYISPNQIGPSSVQIRDNG